MKIALFLISLTLTLSIATPACPGFASVSAILRNYQLPPGLFPADVDTFECIPDNNMLNLTIKLKPDRLPCTVTTKDFAVQYQKTISATVFDKNIINLKGLVVTETNNTQDSTFVKVTEVRAFFNLAFQFKYVTGYSNVYFFKGWRVPYHCDPLFLVYGPLFLGA